MRLRLSSYDPFGRHLTSSYKLQVSLTDTPSHTHHFPLEHARPLKPCIFLPEDISALSFYAYYRQTNAPAEKELDKNKLSIAKSY